MTRPNDEKLERVYGDLRRIAESLMRRESPGHTLQATALVHEAYLRLAGETKLGLFEATELLAIAARVMQQILIDHDRGRKRQKRGGSRKRVPLSDAECTYWETRPDMVEGMDEISVLDPLAARVYCLRHYFGFTQSQIAAILGFSRNDVGKNLEYAQAWLDRRNSR